MKNFFLSLKTTVWTLLALVCLFFIGSYMMPVHRDVFSGMNDDILVRWIENTASNELWFTWWFFAAMAGLVLLAVNALVCSYKAIQGKWSHADFLPRVAPQLVHLAFLFILLAHVLGAGWGYKLSGVMPEGSYAQLPEKRTLQLQRINIRTDDRGNMIDWSARVSVYENKRLVKSGTIEPNAPVFFNGIGIYVKDLSFDQGPAAAMLIARDPGAVWALVGGILFMLGSIALLTLKLKKA